ncbi:unnamed protein product [marine sediment metagenome]|uniref:AB hydrolase-1 domain-containing protein n=1 Tax=marine sediment metagenome TaxID=412755 RepID=X1G251_9ZZZZ
MEAYGEDVRAVVDELELDQVVLVGHSMGGPVILESAQRLQNRVVAIVGVDTFIGKIFTKCTREEIDEYLAPLYPNFTEAVYNWVRRDMFTEKSDPALIERIASDMSAAPPMIGLGALEELLRWDLTMALQEVKAPIRCINSYRDPNLEAQYASYFDVVHVLQVGRHFVMMEDPDIFNRLLAEAIQELVRPD